MISISTTKYLWLTYDLQLIQQDFRLFMTFCAIGLLNAQLLDRTFCLTRRLKVGLSSPTELHVHVYTFYSKDVRVYCTFNETMKNSLCCCKCDIHVYSPLNSTLSSCTCDSQAPKATKTAQPASMVSPTELLRQLSWAGLNHI